MIVIAQRAGFLNRKCDGPPGFECLWKGYAILNTMVKMMQLYHTSTSTSHQLMRRSKSVGQAQG